MSELLAEFLQTWEVFYHPHVKPTLDPLCTPHPTRQQDEGRSGTLLSSPFPGPTARTLLRAVPQSSAFHPTRTDTLLLGSWDCRDTDAAALLAKETIKQLAERPCYTRYNVVIPELYFTMKRCFYFKKK